MRSFNRSGLVATALLGLALAGCDKAANTNGTAAEPKAAEANGGTIGAGLAATAADSKFLAAAKAAGLEPTLAGTGPYTVLVPSDAAFDKLPAGALDGLMKPDAKAQLTGVLTYHILPGTILAADIGKAIDNAKGKAVLATMGGGTLTATRDGDRIILADKAGAKAAITAADEQHSNGVVHHIDSVLMPS